MLDISGIFSIKKEVKSQLISLCGYLEAIVGHYFLADAGDIDAYWYGIYYDPSINTDDECVETVDKNLIGYVYCDDRVAFILNDFLESFVNDTADYHIHCIGVDSLKEDCLECRNYSAHSENILPAFWIDDDFLSDENIPFDYESFELIDDGVKYMNPKHFSVKKLVKYCRLSESEDDVDKIV